MRENGNSVGRIARRFTTLVVAFGLAATVAGLGAPAPARADLVNGFQCPDYSPNIHLNPLLPDGTFAQPYSAQIGVSGGTPPYTFEINAGSWPLGLLMDSSGVVSGIPLTAGNFQVVVGATDSSSPAQCASEIFYLHLANGTEGAQQTVEQAVRDALSGLNDPYGVVGCVEATASTLVNHTPPGDHCGDLPRP
jgi:hypothetical protein